MNRRDIIRICFVIFVALWLTAIAMPRRYGVIQELTANYYDRQMTSQEYRIKKEQKALAENKLISEEEKLDSLEFLAKTYWATFRTEDAIRILEQVRDKRSQLSVAYSQKTINTLLALAGAYRDANQLIKSADCYEHVWQLDKEHLPADDGRLVRDQSNLAMLDYVRGDSDKDEKVRCRFFKNSIDHLKLAQEIWHKQKNPDTAALANLFYLQYLDNREIGNQSASKQAYGEMKYLNRLLKRTYTPPWT